MRVVGQLAQVLTFGCLCAAALHAAGTATADPAHDDTPFPLLSGGYTAAEWQASNPYPEDPFLARLGCGPNSQPDSPSTAIVGLCRAMLPLIRWG
jgi:hypothetical protein